MAEPEARFRLREGRIDIALDRRGNERDRRPAVGRIFRPTRRGTGERFWSPVIRGRWDSLAEHVDVLGKPFDFEALLTRIAATRRTA